VPDGWHRPVAAAVVAVLALVNCAGITRTAGLTRVIVALVLVALAVAVAAALGVPEATVRFPGGPLHVRFEGRRAFLTGPAVRVV
jgi:APA family basic amino acid/polyamine antiporter